MAKVLVDDALWELIEPHLPRRKPQRTGRPRVPDRDALRGIIFVLISGTPWEYLPLEMGCGSGMTCWRRLRDWQQAGVWTKVHRVLLEEFQAAGRIDWSRAVVDSSSVRALKGGSKLAPTRPIAGARAASTTPSPMRKGSRWWSRSLLRMIMTSPSSSRSSTRSRRSGVAAGGRASGRRASRATAPITRKRTRRNSDTGTSSR
jgi:transposase